MGRITWQLQQDTSHWLGNVGARVAFVVKPSPDNKAWDILFNWTGVTFEGFPNIASTRDACERKLVLFAEQTGLTLPDGVEEENTLAQELIERLRGEMRWFKAEDTPEKRAEYLAVQAISTFLELVVKPRKYVVDGLSNDIGYTAAITELNDMHEQLQNALVDLGVEQDDE